MFDQSISWVWSATPLYIGCEQIVCNFVNNDCITEVNKPVNSLDPRDRLGDKADFGSFIETEQYLRYSKPVFTRLCRMKERCKR